MNLALNFSILFAFLFHSIRSAYFLTTAKTEDDTNSNSISLWPAEYAQILPSYSFSFFIEDPNGDIDDLNYVLHLDTSHNLFGFKWRPELKLSYNNSITRIIIPNDFPQFNESGYGIYQGKFEVCNNEYAECFESNGNLGIKFSFSNCQDYSECLKNIQASIYLNLEDQDLFITNSSLIKKEKSFLFDLNVIILLIIGITQLGLYIKMFLDAENTLNLASKLSITSILLFLTMEIILAFTVTNEMLLLFNTKSLSKFALFLFACLVLLPSVFSYGLDYYQHPLLGRWKLYLRWLMRNLIIVSVIYTMQGFYMVCIFYSFHPLVQVYHNYRNYDFSTMSYKGWYVIGFLNLVWLLFLPSYILGEKNSGWEMTLLFVLYFGQHALLRMKSKILQLYMGLGLAKLLEVELVDQECPICLQALRGADNELEIIKTKCGHVFHDSCINRWYEVNINCPSCRSDLTK